MIKLSELNILGKRIALHSIPKSEIQGISIGDKLSYSFYDGKYMDVPMLFLQPKGKNPTPRVCKITAQRISAITGNPVVFILKNGPTFERQRLLDKGIYFVMSANFAHLPMLTAMEKSSNKKPANMLTPVAQYMLLYHLQVRSIAGLTAKQIQELLPYSYASITLGMTCLDDLGLARKIRHENKSKVLAFKLKGAELWAAAAEYLMSPVERHIYCDVIDTEQEYPTAGINALSHYSMLNPDPEQIIAVTLNQFHALEVSKAFEGLNTYDGNVNIEIWKYSPILMNDKKYVDPLSLALSLKNDEDPRVEGEVEQMIKNIIWKD